MSAKKDKSDKPDAPPNGNPPKPRDREECFVIMPISDPDGYAEGHFGRVYEDLFVPACERAGYKAVRADEVRQTNLIHLDVLQKIIESPMAICDLSSRNPNVLFELGLRQAFDKPVVLVQEVGTPSIFDINPLRYTTYRKEMLYRQVIEDQREIEAAISATKEDIGNSRSVNSIVRLLSLARPASLANISESEKDTALLRVIMAEIGNLRGEIREAQRGNQVSTKDNTKVALSNAAEVASALVRIRSSIFNISVSLASVTASSPLPPETLERIKTVRDLLADLDTLRREGGLNRRELMEYYELDRMYKRIISAYDTLHLSAEQNKPS